nr:MAG TPA: tail tube protein [Caudoviricetes sp.]
MANKKNKVKFNICNVHYALITVAEEGSVTFGTPVPMPGAVSISMDPTGEPESFYADGIEYYVINNNQGYDGDLELAMIPESFRTDILKEEADANKVLVENANSETGSFALLFEFDGDIRKIRHVLYNCSASRPTIESKTNEEDKEVQTETLTIKARPMASGYVKAKTGDSTTDTVYNNWYKTVYEPTAVAEQASKSTQASK